MSDEVQSPEATEENPRPDTPAAAHQKKLAKERSKRAEAARLKKAEQEKARIDAKKEGKKAEIKHLADEPIVYTRRGKKVLKVEVRENGTYTSYVGNAERYKEHFEAQRKLWKEAGVWIADEDLKEKIQELREKHFPKAK